MSFPRRRCVCWLITILASCLIGYSLRPISKGSKITKANLDKIVKGMTQEDVEEIFGCPPGDYTNGEAIIERCGIGVLGISRAIWIGYEGDIEISFSKKDGTVIDKYYTEPGFFPKPTWLDRIKGFIKRALSTDW